MPSPTYTLIARAMEDRRQIAGLYKGLRRVLVPVVLGWSEGREKLLAYQVSGASSRALRGPETRWRCLFVDELSGAALSDGPVETGGSHQTEQTCVREVDLDVNPASPFSPRRKLGWQR